MRPLALLAALMVLTACTDNLRESDAGVAPPDAQPDSGIVDTGKTVDSGVVSACDPASLIEQTINIDPDGSLTQIHVNVTFDGEGIWVAYSLPSNDGSNGFSTWATRLRCDGSTWVAPFRVTTAGGFNDIDPSVAVSGDVVLVAWQRDTGLQPYNLVTLTRRFQRDGTALDAQEVPFALLLDGVEADGNIWMPSVVALPNENFAMAIAYGDPMSTGGFQLVLQRILGNGTLDGSGINVFLDPPAGQVFPKLAADATGSVWASWTRSSVGEDDIVAVTRVAASSTIAEPSPPQYFGTESSGAYVALDPAGESFVAYHSATAPANVVVQKVDPPSIGQLQSGATGSIDHSPGIAFHAAGEGLLLQYRVDSGFANKLYVRSFQIDAGGFAASELQQISEENRAAPYGAAITHLVSDWYFVAWQEGVNPAFRIKGRFVQASRL